MKYQKGNTPSNFKDLTGQVFGKISVLKRHANSICGKARWYCRCACGKDLVVTGSNLQQGQSSCGCDRSARVTHGMSGTKTFRVWVGILTRCNNKRSSAYKHYGGRGISVCDRWDKFENFLEDMGECPDGMSIERINVNGNYEPSNCIWIHQKDQAKNKRTTKTALGMPASEAAKALGMNYFTLLYRIKNNIPVEKEVGREKYIALNGEVRSISEWSKLLCIPKSTISVRLKKGMSPEEILKVKNDKT